MNVKVLSTVNLTRDPQHRDSRASQLDNWLGDKMESGPLKESLIFPTSHAKAAGIITADL